MKTLSVLLTPRKSVYDQSRRDVVLDLTDLAEGKIDPESFFSENFITNGMKQLYEAVFKRLEGRSDDGIFKLTQAMGGGKTHNMVAIGLLAKYPEFRESTMGHIYKTSFRGTAKIVSFSGHQKPDDGIWGEIAGQLGKKEQFKKFYSAGLKAPGQSDWISLLQGEPVVIILDELPPYFQNASTVAVGNGTLADVTTTALASLLVAVGKDELKNVALLISDLNATSYQSGSNALAKAFDDFERETNRLAKNFTPVQQNSDELYHILRKRIFENEATASEIEAVANAYGEELDKANRITGASESVPGMKAAIKASYPFHPSMRELYARFKENSGFMQTRGLIRLLRTTAADMFHPKNGWADKSYLIHPFDVNPNDANTLSELTSINDKLINAISNDIASSGSAAAEKFSAELANDLPNRTARLLLMASLGTVSGSVKGLKANELTAYLAQPGVDISSLQSKVLPELRERSWYLHVDNSGSYLYKDVQNVSAMVNSYRSGFGQEAVRKEIIKKLEELFKPLLRDCYQQLFVLPALDEVSIVKDKVSLIIFDPDSSGKLNPRLEDLYNGERLKNRMMFLTGDHMNMQNIYNQAKGIKATEAVIATLLKDGTLTNDPQMEEANRLKESYQFKFLSAVQNVFTKLYYPTINGLTEATIDLLFQGNKYNGEEQVKKTLEAKRKFNVETSKDTFVRKIEAKLFTEKSLPWADILQNAASKPDWDWHHPNALEDVKRDQLSKELWRENGNWIEKGPFPAPPTRVELREVSRERETGKVSLKLNPINGDTIRYCYGKGVSETSPVLDYRDVLTTDEMEVEFICIDSKGEHQTGDLRLWTNTITLQHKFISQGTESVLELRVAPPNAQIRYTTDGSTPSEKSALYEAPFVVRPGATILVIGLKGAYRSETLMVKAPMEAGKVEIDKKAPLVWKNRMKKGNTSESYALLKVLNKAGAQMAGLDINSSKGSNWIQLSLDENTLITPEKGEEFLGFVRENGQQGEISLEFTELRFESGQQFLDLIRELSVDYRPEDIHQK